ncbi:MAG: leucine-rich repeat domain-containing protein [Bacteroides sp.]|nr:leucine-rich repeat domain-containing protein [Eubacterium sp.]MCM1418523.1 leucine-rich repeat domain-containing protein [Roseburia sp.]MCM1462596.1 leucine-rich repeat domain-containing protein [Bacteroides sp.]
MKKILSLLLVVVLLAGLFPVRGYAATKKVKLCGEAFSPATKRLCLVSGEEDNALALWAARTYAPEYTSYTFIGKETVDLAEIAEKLPTLQSLFIVSANVKNLDALSELKDLKQLVLYNNDGAEELSFLKKAAGLTLFRYYNMSCEGIEAVGSLKKLTELSLDVPARAMKDLAPIKNLTKLKKLSLGYGAFEDLSALKKLKNLRELEIDNRYLKDISALKSLKKLERLTLSRTEEVKGGDLAALKQLTSLTLNNCQMRDFDSISKLDGLKTLSVTGLTGISVYRFYDAIAHMTELSALALCDVSIGSCDFLSGLTELKELYLLMCDVEDISGLKKLKNLETLCLSYNKIADISALKGLKKLTALELAQNEIEDISAVSGMTELKTLNLNMTQVRDLSPVKKLTKLEYLGIAGAYLADPEPILKLTSLRELYAPDSAVDEAFAERLKSKNPGCEIFYEWET